MIDIEKNSVTVVRVDLNEYAGQNRLDVRECLDLERTGEHRPTKKGINLSVAQLPQLRAALQEAEAEALRRGILTVDDYAEAGMTPPTELVEV